MRKKTILTLITCIILCALMICEVQAQMGPSGRGNASRGGATRGGTNRGGFGGNFSRGFGRGQITPPGPPALHCGFPPAGLRPAAGSDRSPTD